MSASLENQFISDRYTSLLHLSGSSITADLDSVFDGLGNAAPIQISDSRVVIGAGSSIIDVDENENTVSINNILLPTVSTATTLYDVIFPKDSIYLTATNTNPSNTFVGTIWELVSEGRYLAGVGVGTDADSNVQAIEEGSDLDTVGVFKHTLTQSEMPKHKHGFSGADGDASGQSKSPFVIVNDDAEQRIYPGDPGNEESAGPGAVTRDDPGGEKGIFSAGQSQPHNNTPPYFGVYVWKRTL